MYLVVDWICIWSLVMIHGLQNVGSMNDFAALNLCRILDRASTGSRHPRKILRELVVS